MLFFTDPHLGLNRSSHTTLQSRDKLQWALYLQVINAIDRAKCGEVVVCCGDLFDTTDNSEAIIKQGAMVVKHCNYMLSGNHDLPNRDSKLSSLQLINELTVGCEVVINDATPEFERTAFDVDTGNPQITFIPHKRSQELFDQTIENALSTPEGFNLKFSPECRIIVLHCNYDSPFAVDKDASLNLTKAQAEALLTVYDFILIGHEHIPRSDFGGRLQILGNTHPTSFSDISDKFVWRIKGKTLTKEMIWDAKKSYLKLDWSQLDCEPSDSIQFVEVAGLVPADQLPKVCKQIHNLWKKFPNAYMIRNNVKSEALVIKQKEMGKAVDIPTRITNELQGSPLANIWNHYLGQLS